VPTLIFPPSLLTNPAPPPRAQAGQKEHGIASGAAANSRSAEEHLDAQFDQVPSTWQTREGRNKNAKKPDLQKASFTKPNQKKRAKMEAVCAFDAGSTVTQFCANALTLDALVAIYNKLPCIQNDPVLVMQGALVGRNPGGNPGKSS
jgi:hypothetical protein